MTPEQKAAHDTLILELKTQVENSIKEKSASKEELVALKSQLTALEEKSKTVNTPADYEALKAEHVTLMAQVKALNEKPAVKSVKGYKTIGEALFVAFEEKKAEIEEILKNGGVQTKSLNIEVKNAVVMSDETTIDAGSTAVSLTSNTGIISTIRQREEKYLAQVSVGSVGGNRALWIEETDQQGTPIMLGEGDAKTQLSVLYVEKTQSVKKIAVYGKVTTELMADLPQLISYIQNNLMKRMDIVLENQLLAGNNTGDNLAGLSEFATAFSAGSLAATIANANEFDVVEAIALQVKVAFGIPKALFVHPSTVSKMKLIKDEAGRPVWKDYVTINGSLNISGLNIIETTAVTAGNFIGGDTSVVNVLNRSSMGIQIGLDGNDFTQNKKTMLLEKRLVQFVSANDLAVIVDGDFATAIAALEVGA